MQDHRRLGREIDLFDTDPLMGAGRRAQGRLSHVHSPVPGKRELYEISRHWAHYREGMYPPMEVGAEQLVLRPSLCPHHALIFRSRSHSYRELPLRIAEPGGLYRSELSGVLGGLTRVRSIQLNDAHIFCTPDQVGREVAASLAIIRQAHRDLGIEPARFRLSLAGRGAKYAGSQEIWDQATQILKEALADVGLPYDAEEGEAAFYGPKIDIQTADSSEREATLSTIQVDFYQPERFNLTYVGPDGGKHGPVMVHRSIIGSLERLTAHLIETHQGAFPPWYAPTQLAILPIGEDQMASAEAVMQVALDSGLRAELSAPEAGRPGQVLRTGARAQPGPMAERVRADDAATHEHHPASKEMNHAERQPGGVCGNWSLV